MKRLIFFSVMCLACLRCSRETGESGTYTLYKEYLIDSYVSVDHMSISPVRGATFAINCSGPVYSITSDDAANVAKFKELAAKRMIISNKKQPLTLVIHRVIMNVLPRISLRFIYPVTYLGMISILPEIL